MAVGLGARKSNADSRYFVAAQANPDNYVSGGVASGRTLVPFPGMGGAAQTNLDTVSALVWLITAGAIAVVLGVHLAFGDRRLF